MPLAQIRGAWDNFWSTLGGLSLGDLLPPSIVSTIRWARDTIPRGLGFASRRSHITGVIALTLVMIIASATVLTVVAVVFFIVAFPIALLRLIPAVERRWPFSASDWPFWTVQSAGFGA